MIQKVPDRNILHPLVLVLQKTGIVQDPFGSENLFIQIDLEAAKFNIAGVNPKDLPRLGPVLKSGWPSFIPIIILPQIFLGGILWPVEQMPKYLQYLSDILPLTYAVSGLRDIMLSGKSLLDVWVDFVVLIGFTVLTTILAALTLRRNAG